MKGRSQNQKKGRNEPKLPSGEVIKVDKWNKTDSSGGAQIQKRRSSESDAREERVNKSIIRYLFFLFIEISQ